MNAPKDIFTEAYHSHADSLFRHALFKVSDRELAKDLVQETFTKTWAYIAKSGTVESLKPFLFRTLNNLIIDEYRKRKNSSLDELMDEGFDIGVDNSESLFDTLDGERALALLRKLPQEYQDVIYMRYVEGLSPQEISEILGESKNTLSVRIHRGLKKLEQLLEHGK